MLCKSSLCIGRRLLSILLALFIGHSFVTYSQHSSEDTRGFKPREYAERIQNQFAQKRPRSKKSKPKMVVKYLALTNNNASVTEGIDGGITVLRLRVAMKTDEKNVQEQTRIAVRKKGQPPEKTLMMTPLRA